MGSVFSASTVDKALRLALSGLAARQRAIANNVANVDTPGFKGTEVLFERQLQQALSRYQALPMAYTHPKHYNLAAETAPLSPAPQVVTTENSSLRSDGNNVDIDREMAKLADTYIKYNLATYLTSARLGLLRSIVGEGRR